MRKKRGDARPLVGVIMGSRSDWETMSHTAATLEALGVPHEVRVVSAHRTPDLLFEYADSAARRGLGVIIAAAGGAAHLPGMTAAKTPLPVLGVPIESRALNGLDSLLSIVQMPAGVPVGTLAIGRAGAVNAALLACTDDHVHGVASALLVVARMVGMLVGISVLTTLGLRRFYAEQSDMPSPFEVCGQGVSRCAEFTDLVQQAGIAQLQTVFACAAVASVVAAVMAVLVLRGAPTSRVSPALLA